MATPRKHWFRVADSIGREPFDNDELATIIRLMCELNTRWARDGLEPDEACRAVFSPGDLMALTGRKRLDYSRLALSKLEAKVSLTVSLDGAYTSIEWPKWSKFQELLSRTEGNSREEVSPSASARRKTQDAYAEEKKKRAPSAPDSPPARRRVLVEKPTDFPDESKERIRAWAERKGFDRDTLNHGLDLFRDWTPLKPPYRRTIEQWEGAFKTILRSHATATNGIVLNNRESAAQARARRTDEAARKAFDMLTKPNLTAIEGGSR